VPKYGVYASKSFIDEKWYPSVTNIGIRPTVKDGSEITVETHILDFEMDVYGETVELQFLEFVRAEKKFESLSALKKAVHEDINSRRKY
jgi:riboflavin kinase/FMN adenylyltransferase